MNTTVSPSEPGAMVPYENSKAGAIGFTDTVATLVIFLYWLVYENIVFFYSMESGGTVLLVLTNSIKLFLPFGLLLYTGLPPIRLLARGYTSLYIAFFVAFLFWGLIPTLISGDPLAWFKLLPRFVFFLSVLSFFFKRPVAFRLFAKCMVLYVLSALLQYILIYVTGAYDSTVGVDYARLAGPMGLLGNVTSMMRFAGSPFPFIRLTGFWNEPSNASGSAFAAFYLARYLVAIGERPRWRMASYGCLVAGILALSTAGYFAFFAALTWSLLFGVGKVTAGRVFRFALSLSIAAALMGIVVFGRTYVYDNLPDNVWARAITGARDFDDKADDVTSGRLDLAKTTIETSVSGFIGVGIQEVGSEGIEGPATAPLFWLLLTGFPGLGLLLCREAVLLTAMRSIVVGRPAMLLLTQALIVVVAQHLSYGTWMNPNYFILAAMVLSCAQKGTLHPFASNRFHER